MCYADRMKKAVKGNLITNGVRLEPHEINTVVYYLARGEDIELIPPSNTPMNKNADFLMRGLVWELKCPMGKGLATVQHLFRKAAKQSENVIFDLRNFKGSERQVVALLNKLFNASRRVKRMHLILSTAVLIEKP